jgi:hypothetical protein
MQAALAFFFLSSSIVHSDDNLCHSGTDSPVYDLFSLTKVVCLQGKLNPQLAQKIGEIGTKTNGLALRTGNNYGMPVAFCGDIAIQTLEVWVGDRPKEELICENDGKNDFLIKLWQKVERVE